MATSSRASRRTSTCPTSSCTSSSTTLKQKLVRKKNRKLRRLRELYPDVRIKLFYARDFRMLLLKFGRLALSDELTGSTGQATSARAEPADAPPHADADDARVAGVRPGAPAPVQLPAAPPVDTAAEPAPGPPPGIPASVPADLRSRAEARGRRRGRRRRHGAAAATPATPVPDPPAGPSIGSGGR